MLLILFLITISAVSAENININPDDSGGINDAINTIGGNSDVDNTITLNPGTYNKTQDRDNNINSNNKNLTIQGNGSTDSVIIDAENLGRIFSIGGNSNITFINMTFINGNEAVSAGGAILHVGDGILNLINCTFKDNTALIGGAIHSNIGQVEVSNCKFINNAALEGNGGAINRLFGLILVNDSIFENNTSNLANGGAISSNQGDIEVSNSTFTRNNAYENGGAINSISGSINVINSEFTENIAGYDGGALFINSMGNITGSNFTRNNQAIFINNGNVNVLSCNIINNTQGILINNSSINTNINYNRIFNNTDYDIINMATDTNADYNWWGNNTPTKIIGIIPNNYFVMNITNTTSLNSNGTVTFQYTFRLNTDEDADNSLLPYFITEVYFNLTSSIIESFDARYNNTFDVTVNHNGNILYTFVTDNEIQTLEGNITIPPEPPIPPIPPKPPKPTPTPEPDTNKTINNPTVQTVMKETGIPINILLLVLCSSLGIIIYRKQK